MSTLLLSHYAASIAHAVPAGHPERPDRIRAVEKVLAQEKFAGLIREEAPIIDRDRILLAHPEDYVAFLEENAPQQGFVGIDGDTTLSPGTMEASKRAAGGTVAAVDAVLSGRVQNAFVATRPPGHHAEKRTAMGFCFFNSVAIAARHAQKHHGVGRVAIIDFDVHHGNGTQDIFWGDQSVMYCSTHQMPLYPGTGASNERGDYDQIVNVPLYAGAGGDDLRDAFQLAILPRVRSFAPELIIISAGFDAHHRDPLASLEMTEQDFGWATRAIMDAAEQVAKARVVSVLEGGYDLQGLSASVDAHVSTLMQG